MYRRTNTGWEVEPVVSGQFWSGQEVLAVPAQSMGVYSVTYQPMVMTTPAQKHTVRERAAGPTAAEGWSKW